jgi:hypothetical protein
MKLQDNVLNHDFLSDDKRPQQKLYFITFIFHTHLL